jgi:hypothetical protein
MAIDWGQIGSVQQQSKVVAQLPVVQQQDSAGSAIAGLANGIQQGMSIKGQMLQNQGQEIQNEGMKTQNEMSQLKLDQVKQGIADDKQVRSAFGQSVDQGMDVLRKTNYVQYIEIKKNQAVYDRTVAETAKLMTDTKANTAQAANQMKITYAGAAAAAMQVQQLHGPEAAQKQWEYQLGLIDESVLKSSLPPDMMKFNEKTYFTAVNGGADAMDQMAQQEAAKNSTPEMKKTQRIASLQNKANLSPQEKSELDLLTAKDPVNQEKITTQENSMRSQFISITKPFQDVNDAYGRVQASISEPSAAGDLALIFNYMKMLDPGSTVREGEFATAQNSAGVPDIIRAQYNKISSGERLADKQRNDFAARATKLYNSQKESYQQQSEDFKKKAKASGLNPDNVVVDFTVKSRESASKSYSLNGQPFDMQAALRDNPGMTEEQIIKAAGLK